MCTAVKYISDGFYFGRTLDNDTSYGEEIAIAPRRYRLILRDGGRTIQAHNAMIGAAVVKGGQPLYYDAVNEKGLAMAGLNFVGNAFYRAPCSGKDNVATFELIPYILGLCATVDEAKRMLARINITDTRFDSVMPNAELHWIIADRNGAITVESDENGVNVYDNPVGILTNNPPFPQQLTNLNNYMCLSPRPPKNNFSDKLSLQPYSRGMGGMGMPGDLSSESRFVRAAFTALNSPPCKDCGSSVGQFFHILDAVAQPRGSCQLDNGGYETTIYSSCCNADKGVYYYHSYDDRAIRGVDMHRVGIDGTAVIRYPMLSGNSIIMQN